MVSWSGILSAGSVVVAQALWWPLGPRLLGAQFDIAALWPVAALGLLAAAAVAVCRDAPEVAVAAAVASTAMGIALLGSHGVVRPADAIAGPLAVVLTLFGLTMRVSRARSAVAACAVPAVFTVLVVVRGAPPRTAIGIGLVLGAGCALVWTAGLGHRARRAKRRAEQMYHRAAATVPAWVAAAERRRLAAELHDVAAHRLTGIAVAAAAGLRLGEPHRRAAATAYAAEAGRQAVDELDRLVSLEHSADPPAGDRIEELVATHGVDDVVRSGPALSPEGAAFVYAVVREALTNASRYAATAAISVRVDADRDRLRVSVADGGGDTPVSGLGGGHGLAGLATRARAMGGTLTAGPQATGWRVQADVPLPVPGTAAAGPPRPGSAVRDRALAVLAAGVSLGVVLLPADDDVDLLAQPGSAAFLLTALITHASTVAWRRTAPTRATAAAIGLLASWIAISTGWHGPDSGSLFLGSWWIELVMVYSLAAYGRAGSHTWWAPAALSALGGAALAAGPEITGNRVAAATILAGAVFVPAMLVWAAGLVVRTLRRRRTTAAARDRAADQDRAADAARQTRLHLADRLRGDARRQTLAVVAAADAADLAGVVTAARAALTALREVVQVAPPDDTEPPPGLAGLRGLAARRRAALSVTGSPRESSAAVEVTAYRTAAMLLGDGSRLALNLRSEGVELTVRQGRPLDSAAVREVHRLVADADGHLDGEPRHGSVRIWLPNPQQ